MGDRFAPPAFNFAVLPNVGGEDPYWQIKRLAIERQQLAPEPTYQAIEVPATARSDSSPPSLPPSPASR